MADHLGYRQKFGVLGPSTNTIVQPDFDDLRPVGVTNHYSRIAIPNDPVNDDASFLRLVDNINLATLDAVDILRSCEMDYLVMGMSAATFWAFSRFKSRTATLAPRRANSRAVASPSPEPPPVTNALMP